MEPLTPQPVTLANLKATIEQHLARAQQHKHARETLEAALKPGTEQRQAARDAMENELELARVAAHAASKLFGAEGFEVARTFLDQDAQVRAAPAAAQVSAAQTTAGDGQAAENSAAKAYATEARVGSNGSALKVVPEPNGEGGRGRSVLLLAPSTHSPALLARLNKSQAAYLVDDLIAFLRSA